MRGREVIRRLGIITSGWLLTAGGGIAGAQDALMLHQVSFPEARAAAVQESLEQVQSQRALAEQAVVQARADVQRVAAEKQALKASVATVEDRTRTLQTPRDTFADRLQGAHAHVAETRSSARGR